jgi:hypothetical protein
MTQKRPVAKRAQKAADEVPKFRTGLRFETILTNAEQSIRLDLDKARLESNHSLTIGEQTEAAVRTTLRGYLPASYSVGHGHIYDAYGDGSQQTDLVITNPDHPLSFPEDRAGTYVVDGVAAAGEVKAKLTAKDLNDCIHKGTRFKELRLTGRDGDFVMTTKHQEYMRQVGMVPPFFVIAIDSSLQAATVGNRLMKAGLVPPPPGKSAGPHDDAHTPQPPVDVICVLGKGVHLYIRPNNPFGMTVKQAPDQPLWAFIPTDAPLAFTLMWLHSAMPQMLRGQSVLVPYLMPTQKNLAYMIERGYITAAPKADAGES